MQTAGSEQQHEHQCSVNVFRNKNIINSLKNFIISIMTMRASDVIDEIAHTTNLRRTTVIL